MTAGYTTHGLNKQTPGTNDNAWGDVLNDEVIQLVDEFIAGRAAFALSGTKTLTSTNGVTNEARMAILHITGGTGGAITVPARSKLYLVFNEASGPVTIGPSGGVTTEVVSTEASLVFCDGADAYTMGVGGESWKAYVDEQAFAALTGDLPGQTGNEGKMLATDGTVASWQQVSTRPDFIQAMTAADKRARGFAYFPRS